MSLTLAINTEGVGRSSPSPVPGLLEVLCLNGDCTSQNHSTWPKGISTNVINPAYAIQDHVGIFLHGGYSIRFIRPLARCQSKLRSIYASKIPHPPVVLNARMSLSSSPLIAIERSVTLVKASVECCLQTNS